MITINRKRPPSEARLSRCSVMIVAAHPDDEAIGVGSRLSGFQNLVAIVHVTDGSPRTGDYVQNAGVKTWKEYAALRRGEFERAMKHAGARPRRTICLWCPDQQAMRRIAVHTRKLIKLFQRYRPTFVITHPYEGGHPDHDSVAASVQWAVELLKRQRFKVPTVVEFTSYHNSPNGMETGRFLPRRGQSAREKFLSSSEKLDKKELYDCYPSQQNILRQFPICSEPLRAAPVYNFEQPPHRGKLLYEGFGWGITGRSWRASARKAKRVVRSG